MFVRFIIRSEIRSVVMPEELPPGWKEAKRGNPPVSAHPDGGKTGVKMTLKNEMSQKAKAFSVECLLKSGRGGGSERENVETEGGITAELCCSELWEKFDRLGTEMIVTRAGRRMFPTLKIRLHGLQSTATYIIYMDIILAEESKYRYNFQRSEWTVSGPSNGHTSTFYIHPDSPAKGETWMTRHVSFDKVKLTNNRKPTMKDQVSLHSMHKYQPRIHVLEIQPHDGDNAENLPEYILKNRGRSKTFVFRQTAFISVTAYQNQQITNLKIQNNPFAKGFRDTANVRKGPQHLDRAIGPRHQQR